MKRILLVDGNSLIFRAYFAQAYSGYIMKTSSGISTNAVYSFANMITSLLETGNYYDVKVAFDKGKKTFRHEKLDDYKAGRSSTPPELIEQFPIVREFLDAANIKWFELDNFEADDLIGSLAKQAEKYDEFEIEILSNDKDMFQLISEKTKVLIPDKGVSVTNLIGVKELFYKWNVSPNQVPDLKGLMGDSSDNLKGVKGIGEKTAIKLLSNFKNLENLYANIDSIKGSVNEKLTKDKESAFLCKEIATIFCEIEFENLVFEPIKIDLKSMSKFLEKYEMKSLINRLSLRANSINNEAPVSKIEYEVISEFNQNCVAEENYIYFESFEENYHNGKILAVAISNSKGNFIIEDWNTSLLFKEFLSSDKFKKITFDIKKTWNLLDNHSIAFNKESFIFDSMVCMYVIDSNLVSNVQNISRLFDTDNLLFSDEDIYNKGAKKTFDIDTKVRNEFIVSKAISLKDTHLKLIEKLKEFSQTELYENIEFPLIDVLYVIEKNGVLIDRKELEKQTVSTLRKIDDLESKMFDILKGKISSDFNFSSPKQIKELLTETLQLKLNKKQSTDRLSLEKFIDIPVVPLLIEHRKLSKLYSTYLRGFEKFIFSDGKIHTILNQTLTNTGRLSSSEPNIQNISVKDETQKESRKIFIANPGNKFISLDYSQIELRVLAQLGEEKNLLKIFESNGDIHDEAARLIFHLKPEDVVTSEQRRTAKVFNFGIMYGLSGYGLSQDLDVSIIQANNYIQDYHQAFPNFQKYKDELIAFASKKGYALTFANRKRNVNELLSPLHPIREFGKRIAVNTPIQGTAADILKVAMIKIHKLITKNNYPVKMIAQIHDEIIFEIPKDCDQMIIDELKNTMVIAFCELSKITNKNIKINVNLEVNESVGENWYQLK